MIEKTKKKSSKWANKCWKCVDKNCILIESPFYNYILENERKFNFLMKSIELHRQSATLNFTFLRQISLIDIQSIHAKCEHYKFFEQKMEKKLCKWNFCVSICFSLIHSNDQEWQRKSEYGAMEPIYFQ